MSSRRSAEQALRDEVFVRFQQEATRVIIGTCPRQLALNADMTTVFDMTIVFEH